MIRMLTRWGINRSKVNLRSPAFWLITVLMTLAFILSDRVLREYSEDTRILVYTSDEADGLAEQCFDVMESNTPSGFVYERIRDEEELKRLVSINEASCGVVFEDFGQSEDDHSGRIRIYQSAGSADGYVMREVVYPALASLYATSELKEYVRDSCAVDLSSLITGAADEAADYAAGRYELYTSTLDTGIYEIRDIGTSGDLSGREEDGVSPDRQTLQDLRAKRSVFVLMILLTAILCTYDTIHTDRDFYRAFAYGKRIMFGAVRVLSTVVMSTAVSLLLYNTVNTLGI